MTMPAGIEDAIERFIRTRMSISLRTSSHYTGGMGVGPLYTESHKIQLLLDDEVISEVSL